MAATELNYIFISPPPDNLKCLICLELANNPKQCEDCGKLFCSECIEKNGEKPCPHCRALHPKYFKDKRGEREIKELGVRCANMERGCPWTGTIGTLDIHPAICEFALVPCPNKCEDDKDAGEKQVMKKDLDDHLKTKCLKRPFECQHCGEKGTYASITGDHDKICDKKSVACPNRERGCLLSMEQREIKQHASVCEYTEVACAYESIGCGVRILKKDVEKHKRESRENHIDLALDTVSSREEQHEALQEGEALIIQLSGYADRKLKKERFYSLPFYSQRHGYKMCTVIDVNGSGPGACTHISISTKILEGRYDDKLHWPFLGSVTYELLNQLADNGHHSRVSLFRFTDNIQVGHGLGRCKFLPHSSLCHDPATNTQYLLDDTLYFRVSVKVDNHKPWLVCGDKINKDFAGAINQSKALKNGKPSVFKVTGFNSKKAVDDSFISDSFFTSLGGYKMCIKIYLNGNGYYKGKYLSVHSNILKGSYDASLSWPFLGTVTLTLLNQLFNDNHHIQKLEFTSRSCSNVGDTCGCDCFISQSALSHDPVKNTQYLKNDTLYFRVSVNDKSSKSWLSCNFK